MNLSYCLCGDLLEVGSPAKGSRMLVWLGKLPDGQETSVGWEQDGLGWEVVLSMVYAQSTCWMDAVYCWGVVGKRKLLDVVSGKRNMYKVSPGIRWWQYIGSGIVNTAVHGSMVVNTAKPHR